MAYPNNTLTKGEGKKKENRRKSNERKRKRTENTFQRIHGICVVNSPTTTTTTTTTTTATTTAATTTTTPPLFALYLITYIDRGKIFCSEVRDYVYNTMYPEEYTLTETIAESDSHSSTSGEEV